MPRKDLKIKSKVETYGLNAKQIRFCEIYVTEDFFMHGQNSYGKAYGYKMKTPSERSVCRSGASQLLINPNILSYINDLLGDMELNEAGVDKQLNKVIQQDADLKAKMMGVSEFNKLRGRITDKVENKIKGDKDEPLQIQVQIVNAYLDPQKK